MGSDTMEIKRNAYLEQLKIRKDNGMIKIIAGIIFLTYFSNFLIIANIFL